MTITLTLMYDCECPAYVARKWQRDTSFNADGSLLTGEKPHVCLVCNKGFSTSSSLNTHRRIHSGEKPHQCQVCGKRFTASSNLYYHRMTHIKVSSTFNLEYTNTVVEPRPTATLLPAIRERDTVNFQAFHLK